MTISPRDRKAIIAGAVAVGLFVLIRYGILPVYDRIAFQRKDIALKEVTMQKYLEKIEKQAELQQNLAKLTRQGQTIEQSLLKGGTTSLAAADIQRIVDRIAKQSGVDIKSVKVMDAGQRDSFVTVPIQVRFESDLTRTCKFVRSIETDRKLLTIPDLSIRVRNMRKGGEIRVTLQIVGFMKKNG